ncbi:MAG TPA: rhodanese-like domain-containing protein [Verrucomicrobiae bacterium]|nr:rhodanese-like domain-containing protein [Verrucomicrobiae bacterium]
MKTLLTLFASLALVAIANAGEFPDISIEELKTALEAKKVTLIDVNGPQSYKKGHIPSAVEFGTIKGDLATALPKDKKALVVAYCGGPTCQAYTAAAIAAKKLGYKNVKHLSAGISGWVQAGEKTEKVN